MKMRGENLEVAKFFDEFLPNILRMGADESEPLDRCLFPDSSKQDGKGFISVFEAVGIYVLSEEGYLLHAEIGQCLDLVDDLLRGARHLRSPDARDDAEGADIVAPLLDVDVGTDAVLVASDDEIHKLEFGSRMESGIGDWHVTPLSPPGLDSCDHLGEFADGIGAEDKIKKRKAAMKGRFFLLGDAPCHTDDHSGIRLRHRPQSAEVAVNLVDRLFADTAGDKKDDVGAGGFDGRGITHRLQEPLHLERILLVHLTAVGFDEGFHVWCL